MQRVIKGVLLDRIKLETRVDTGLLQRAKNSAFILYITTVYGCYSRFIKLYNINTYYNLLNRNHRVSIKVLAV